MTKPAPAPETAGRERANPVAVAVATGLGLGYAPLAPGTAGSLATALGYALLHYGLESAGQRAEYLIVYLLVLAGLALVGLWSTAAALPKWKSQDPQAIVIDEALGQWIAYAGVVAATLLGLPGLGNGGGWKSLVAGFILFRIFDVWKPFPIRRLERVGGPAGVLLDDALAGGYAAAVTLLLAWRGWLV
ncbi:MAG: phosphatidylglycerophosphatase A [Terriglobia bacterium]